MKIHTITIDRNDAEEVVDVTFTFIFDGVCSPTPWSVSEFIPGSRTRKYLEKIIELILEEDWRLPRG